MKSKQSSRDMMMSILVDLATKREFVRRKRIKLHFLCGSRVSLQGQDQILENEVREILNSDDPASLEQREFETPNQFEAYFDQELTRKTLDTLKHGDRRKSLS